MAETGGRTLAAIMFTDMVGYSALTQKNEALALELLEAHHKLLRPIFPKYGGKEIKTIGDAFLVEFTSALDATRCAIELQHALATRNATVVPKKRIQIRIGIHVGDVVHQNGDVFGDAVNIASRIEPLAHPGGVCVSEDVARQIQNKIDEPLKKIGRNDLKNIQLPVEVYEIALPWLEAEEALVPPTAVEPKASPPRLGWPGRVAWGLTCLLLGSLVAGIAVWNLRTPEPSPIVKSAITLPPNEALANLDFPAVAISPDGSYLAYVASRGANTQLFLRALDSLEAKPIEGTEGASMPFFSPDGQWLGFFTGAQLKKVSISGGAALTLAPATTIPRGASWGDNDMIVFAPSLVGPLSQVPAAGGTPQPPTKMDIAKSEFSHRWPQFLPGSKAVLFTVEVGAAGSLDTVQIVVQNLETGERKALVQGGTYPRYVPTGHLVYYRGGTLMAVPFDLERLEVTGSPSPIVEGVMATVGGTWGAHFSISDRGSLAYVPGGPQTVAEMILVWVDRNGREQPLAAPPQLYNYPRFSPDGRRLLVEIELNIHNVWVYDLERSTLTRLTFEATNHHPIWTPDGKRVTFTSNKSGFSDLFWKPADGSGTDERLTTSEYRHSPQSWTPDGQMLVFVEINSNTREDIWVLPLEGDRKPRGFLKTPFREPTAMLSPDGRWLAYVSDESGRFEVYVQPFPGPGGKWQISTDGGTEPVWCRSGRELFYRNGNKMMAVDIATNPTLVPGTPKLLFEGEYASSINRVQYDVSPDGQRFLMLKATEQEQAATQINVVLNWFEELKRRVPAGQ